MFQKFSSFLFFSCIIFQIHAQTCITVATECDDTNDYCFDCTSGLCGPFELSNGIYRIPFNDGTVVDITNDHFNHCPRGRIDMVAEGAINYIAAAADGWIRAIEDDNDEMCDCTSTFSCPNNYVWIEHPNGEWTKYTHMVENSVSSLGLNVGDWVTAGTALGLEGNVGCASGVHLHFEVAQPIDTNTLIYSSYGGYIDKDWAKNVIPVICSISGNVFEDGGEYTADDCGSCTSSLVNTAGTFNAGDYDADFASSSISTLGAVVYEDYSSGLYQAGNYIYFYEGFEAKQNSEFTARIGGCNEFPDRLSSADEEQYSEPKEFRLKIFPNPAAQNFILSWQNDESITCSIFLTSVDGNVAWEIENGKSYEAGTHQLNIAVNNLSAGIYFLKMEMSDQGIIEKLIIQH